MWLITQLQDGELVLVLSHVFWVLLSVTLHELAHGWAALWQGDDTPRRTGHMTMNPVVHMGWMSLLVFALVGITWGSMPVEPSRFRWKRRGWMVVAAAGPAMNLLLAIAALSTLAFWIRYGSSAEPLNENLRNFLFLGGMLNIVLTLFNLLPIPPLDGSRILAGASFQMYRFFEGPTAQQFGLFALLAIFISGIGGVFFRIGATFAAGVLDVFLAILP